MMRKDALAKIAALSVPGKRALLSTHVRPDGDGLGSEAALARLLSEKGLVVEIWNHDLLPPEFEFLFEGLTLRDPDDTPPDDAYDLFFCLDVSISGRLGRVSKYLQKQKLVKIVLDHHLGSETDADIILADHTSAATGEVVYRLARNLNWPINQEVAGGLWIALHTDTGGFRFSNTTSNALRTGAELLSTGIRPDALCERVYHNRRAAGLALLGKALTTVQILEEGRCAVMHIDKEMYHDTGAGSADTDLFVNLLLQVIGVEVALFVYPTAEGKTKITMRGSKGRSIHELALKLGGGGHAQAAGATVETSIADTRALVCREASKMFSGSEELMDR
jgi:bifunctional oligoribonuclease and PAP phosphatase NrnA